ncbi:MAG: hypothetical protein K0R84_1881 [Clostridia bacterium]|jgi:hypothetical protein|nr:hypothetical protein [Clostridia bacterium]
MNFTVMITTDLINYIKSFNWSRKVTQLHIHHTWKPDHSDYNGTNGIALQRSMKSYHVSAKGWKDIAQHLTLLPDGKWVTGRDFNTTPASITGWNEGAFCIEMLGNFDIGCNRFEGEQAEAMFSFCTFFAEYMKLDVKNDVKFHRDSPTAGKTCPGSSIDKEWFMNEINKRIENTALPAQNEEAWKFQAIDALASDGLINNPEEWKSKINDPMPVWTAMIILNRIYEKLSHK